MSTRLKVLISAVVAVVLLTVTGVATVLAQDEPQPAEETDSNALLARVAEILGISEETLADALEQARQEATDEGVDCILAVLLEEAAISEEDIAVIQDWLADRPDITDSEAIEEWLQQRPDMSGLKSFGRIFGHPGYFKGHLRGIFGQCQQRDPPLGRVAEILEDVTDEELIEAFNQAQQEIHQQTRGTALTRALERAMEQERITESEAEQITDWWNQRPEAVDRAFPGAHIFPAERSRGVFGFHKGWFKPGSPGRISVWFD